ncbi:MAG TPA: amidohydrolase family protein [Stellaceae bacterium]|jgi:predicted TIM-barrel fold metal-dependent hydrolase|nr:amidohydrolase family protein [Stellaceae bacterium]
MMTTPPRAQWQFGRIYPPDEAWLASGVSETILEPDLPIVDPHHHLWLRDGHCYLLDELLADLNSGHNIVATVFLECHSMYRADGPAEMRPVGEVEFVAGIAAMSASGNYGKTRVAAGIVGSADLRLGDRVEPVLLALQRAGGGRFRGIRHSAGYDADPIIGNSGHDAVPHLYAQPDFRAGLARLSALGLSFDAWLYHPQLGDVIDLARAFPATPMIMGHIGGVLGYGPYGGKTGAILPEWKRSMAELATCPNVVLKIGGMINRGAAYDFHAAVTPPLSETMAQVWRPYVETCIELFGADRCMFESNFPVDKMGVGYAALWNAFKRITASASRDEKRALYAGTAARAYRLGDTA